MQNFGQSSLKRIKIFVTVARFGNFNDAAKKLNLTPSAISQNIKNLENELGISLIKRTTRSLFLTDVGKYFYNNADNILTELDYIYNKTINYNKEPFGELKVTCSISFGYSQLSSLIYDFSKKFKNVNININLNDNLVNLNEEDYDIALRITRYPPENYAMRHLCAINWVYCASKEYLSKNGYPSEFEDLHHHNLLMYPNMNDKLKKMDAANPIKSIKSNCSLFSLQAVLNHKGIAYLPLYLLEEHIKSKQIVPLKISNQLIYRTHNLYALYFPSRYNNPRVRLFIDSLIEKFQVPNIWESTINLG